MSIQSKMPPLTLRAVKAVPVEVPLNFVLGTSQQALRQVPLLLIDVATEEGITGRTYLFCYLRAAQAAIMSILGEVESLTKGERIDPAAFAAKLTRRFTLIGVQGIVRMALAGFDTACWDTIAIAAGQPLVTFLGAEAKPIPAYNSCGLGIKDDLGELAAEAETLVKMAGFGAVKLRLGYPSVSGDIAAVRAVRKRIGDDLALMVDYNQVLTLDEAFVRGRALDAENIYWLEEPIRHDDYAGAARLARELKTPIQIGENFSLPANMQVAIDAGAADCVMPDLERIGGVSGWMLAAQIASAKNLKMSSHLFPEVSAHLLAATPTCHYLEYVDWANELVDEPLEIENGFAIIPQRPGNGLVWNAQAVERYRVS
jgi:mandelate racemase